MPFNKGDLVALSGGPYAIVGRYQGARLQDMHAVVRTHFDGEYHGPLAGMQHATETQIDNAIKCDLETLKIGNGVQNKRRLQEQIMRALQQPRGDGRV